MKKIMRRALALLLCLGVLLCASACSNPYIGQTSEEARVVYRLGDAGVSYDLFNFLAQGHENLLTNGDASFWEGKSDAEKKELFDGICQNALEDAAAVYATFALCEKYEIQAEGKDVAERVKKERNTAIENMGGFDAYQVFLKEQNMSDAVFRLYLQEAICRELLSKKLCIPGGGLYPSDEEAVRAYFMSEEAACVSWIVVAVYSVDGQYQSEYSKNQIMGIYADAVAASDAAFRNMAMGYSTPGTVTEEECTHGIYFGKDQMDSYDAALADAIFSLEEGETSEIVETAEGYFLVRKLPKDLTYICSEAGHERLLPVYLQNMLSGAINEKAESLVQGAERTAFGETITREMLFGK